MIDAHVRLTNIDSFQTSLSEALEFSGVSGVIALQSENDNEARNTSLNLAKGSGGLLCGIVTAVPLTNEKQMKVRIDTDSRESLIFGYLADVQKLDITTWINDEDVNYGLELLAEKNTTLDLLTNTEQVRNLLPLLDAHPSLPIMLDHCSGIELEASDAWKRTLREIGRRPHVYYRLSGLTAGLKGDSAYEITESVKPFFDNALEAFGAERVLYGSGWPNLNAPYPAWLNTVDNLVNKLSTDEQAYIYSANAQEFYGID